MSQSLQTETLKATNHRCTSGLYIGANQILSSICFHTFSTQSFPGLLLAEGSLTLLVWCYLIPINFLLRKTKKKKKLMCLSVPFKKCKLIRAETTSVWFCLFLAPSPRPDAYTLLLDLFLHTVLDWGSQCMAGTGWRRGGCIKKKR